MNVSVVIPCYNGAAYLRTAVESLFATGYPNLEILIVDDASTDGSDRVAGELAREHANVRVLQHPGRVNRGEGASRNLAMVQATGEILAFLDADDFVFPNRFETAIRRFQELDEVDGVYDLAQLVFEAGASETFWADQVVGIRKELNQADLLSELLSGRTWIPSTFMCRASLLKKCGMFEEIRGVAIDVNFFLRAVCTGRIVAGNLDQPVVGYRRHGENMFSVSGESYLANVWSMARAAKWADSHNVDPSLRNLYREKFGEYLNTACYEVRRMGRPGVALKMMQKVAGCGQFAALCQYRVLRQGLSAVGSLINDRNRTNLASAG